MDKIDILLTLYSIVSGLGLSRLIQGAAEMIEGRDRLKFYWLHTSWLALVFMAHVVSWFALMRFSTGAHWTVFNATGALCMPILLYLLSDLLVPRPVSEEPVSLRNHYYRNFRWLTGLLGAFVVLGIAVQAAVERSYDWSEGGYLRLIALVVLVAGFMSPRPAVQAAQTLALLVVCMTGATLISMQLM
jgi:hypothetical protein